MNQFKLIINNSLYLVFRLIISVFISLYTSRKLIVFLGENIFGVYMTIISFISLLSFINKTTSNSSTRFLSFNQNLNNYNSVFNVVIITQILTSLIILILILVIGDYYQENILDHSGLTSSKTESIISILAFSNLFVMLKTPLISAIISCEKMKILGVISLVESVLKFCSVIAIGIDGILFEHYLYIILLINIVVFLAHLQAVIKVQPSFTFALPNRALFKEYLIYNAHSVYGDVASTSRIEGTNILINSFFGPSWNAVYSLSAQVYNGLSAIQSGIITAIKPAIIKLFSANSFDEGFKYVNIFSYFMLAFSLITNLIFWLNYEQICHLWLGYIPDLLEGILYVFLVRYIINGVLQIWVIPIHASGKIWRSTFTSGSIYLFSLLIAWFMFKMGLMITDVLVMILIGSLLVGRVYLNEIKNLYGQNLIHDGELELNKLSSLMMSIGLLYSVLFLFGANVYSLLLYISGLAFIVVAVLFSSYFKNSVR